MYLFRDRKIRPPGDIPLAGSGFPQRLSAVLIERSRRQVGLLVLGDAGYEFLGWARGSGMIDQPLPSPAVSRGSAP